MNEYVQGILLIIIIGTVVFLSLGGFITFIILSYQKRRQEHQNEVARLIDAYQKEVLKVQVEMQDSTFNTISEEIHDNVGQLLALARLHVSTMEMKAEGLALDEIRATKQVMDLAIEELRTLAKRLNKNYQSQQRLSDLLRFQVELINKTGALIANFYLDGEEPQVNPEKKLILFRIAQEAISNIIRHAGAKELWIDINYSNKILCLSIRDNGIGFVWPYQESGNIPVTGTGLNNMIYRARLIGANLKLETAPGEGTRLKIEVSFI